MWWPPTNRTLAKIAVYTAFGGITAVMFMRWRIEDRIRNSPYYKLALTTLRSNSGASRLLGVPVVDLGTDLADNEHNYCDGKVAQFTVHVKGSADRGKMFFTAIQEENKWDISRLELEVHSQPDKRFIIKRPPATEIHEDTNDH